MSQQSWRSRKTDVTEDEDVEGEDGKKTKRVKVEKQPDMALRLPEPTRRFQIAVSLPLTLAGTSKPRPSTRRFQQKLISAACPRYWTSQSRPHVIMSLHPRCVAGRGAES